MDRSTSLPMSMVQIKKNTTTKQKKTKLREKTAALQRTDLTFEGKTKRENWCHRGQHHVQIPKGLLINRRADTCRQLTLACMCTAVNWIYKCKADKYDRLKTIPEGKLCSNTALFISPVCQQNAKLFLKFRRFSDNKLRTDVLNPYAVNRSLYLPSNQPILCRMSSSYLLLDCLLTNSLQSERENIQRT